MATDSYKWFQPDPDVRPEYGTGAIPAWGGSTALAALDLAERHLLKMMGYPKTGTKHLLQVGAASSVIWLRVTDRIYSQIEPHLSAAELATVTASMPSGWTPQTTKAKLQPHPTKTNVYIRGDSISEGVQTTSGNPSDVYATQAVNTLPGQTLIEVGGRAYERESKDYCLLYGAIGSSSWANTDAGGVTTAPQREDLAYYVNRQTLAFGASRSIMVYWLGTNDLAYDSGISAADVWARAVTRIQAFAQDHPHIPIIVITALRRTEGSTLNNRIHDYNELMRANYISAGAHVLADFAAIAEFNPLTGDTTNTTYYSADTVHIKTAGHALMIPRFLTALAAAEAILDARTNVAPSNIILPEIIGSGEDEEPLTFSIGKWSGFPAPAFSYQWLRDDIAITDEDTRNFTPSGDAGSVIKIRITATNSQGSVSAESAGVTITGGVSAPTNTVAPVMSGGFASTHVFSNETLEITDDGTWTGSPTAFEYKWQTDGADNGETDDDYIVAATDDALAVRGMVRAQNAGGWSDWVPTNAKSAINLALNLDASDTSTITHSTGSVSQWDDKSGKGYHATQSTPAQRPVTGARTINGLNGIEFIDGTCQMSLPAGLMTDIGGANNSTVFTVVVRDTPSGDDSPLADQSRYRFLMTSTGSYFRMVSTAQNAALTYTPDTSQHIYVGRRSGTEARHWYDGGASAVNNSQSDTTLSVLRVAHADIDLDGVIGQVIIAPRALTYTEIDAIGGALQAKWATPTWTSAS